MPPQDPETSLQGRYFFGALWFTSKHKDNIFCLRGAWFKILDLKRYKLNIEGL
jgi:hypothetical protein